MMDLMTAMGMMDIMGDIGSSPWHRGVGQFQGVTVSATMTTVQVQNHRPHVHDSRKLDLIIEDQETGRNRTSCIDGCFTSMVRYGCRTMCDRLRRRKKQQ